MEGELSQEKLKEKSESDSEELKAKSKTESQISKIIAAINPEYADNSSEVKEILKEGNFWQAVEKAEAKPSSEHILVYDSLASTLEPVYFWILDFMNSIFAGKVEKLVDNFASSVGSGHFSELGGKKSTMQQEASRILGTINNILKSVINLLYDLREWQIILHDYELANSKDKSKAEAGFLALKQRWMDKVDMQRGTGSINALSSGNLQFVTLRDAFMIANSPEKVDELDLNERVKRLLKPRVAEFLEWRIRSEQEMKKRFEIEKSYLKSQVNALKLESRWAKPYLKAARQLEGSENLMRRPDLVSMFNIILLELILMGKSKVKVAEAAIDEKFLPKSFAKMKNLRDYYSVVLVEFNFRGVPTKTGQHYSLGGRAEVKFKAYGLNSDELGLLDERLKESDLDDSLKLVEGMTDESLEQIKKDIEDFIGDKKEKVEEKEKVEDTNPFSALFSFFRREKKTSKEDKKGKIKEMKEKGVKPDNYAEKYIRNLARAIAINRCYDIFDIYKKGHGMASFPYVQNAEAEPPKASDFERFLGLK